MKFTWDIVLKAVQCVIGLLLGSDKKHGGES